MIKKILNFLKRIKNSLDEKSRIQKILEGQVVYEEGNLNAESCWNMTKYNRFTSDMDLIIKEQVELLNKTVVDKTQISKHETNLVITKEPGQEEFYNRISQDFERRGFAVFTQYFEPTDDEVLVISWKKLNKGS